jgi:hypothetical protein
MSGTLSLSISVAVIAYTLCAFSRAEITRQPRPLSAADDAAAIAAIKAHAPMEVYSSTFKA